LDVNNPSDSDPTTPPQTISFPTGGPPNPYPSGIPTQPDSCDGENPSNDCFSAMSGSGGHLYFAKDFQCSDSSKSQLETAVWDATTLAFYSSSFPDAGEGTHGQASGIFYMGPDFASQKNRISGNLKRVWQFKTDTTSEKEYITVSCKDTKNLCGKMIDGKAYYYITLCPAFFSLDSLSTKINDVEQDLAGGSTKMAKDMTYLRTSGQFFLHEMMNTRIADGGVEPHIIDEYVVRIPDGEKPGTNDVKAYGPRLVHNLAKRSIQQGGGVTRASTNADSYAILANAIWWWDTTGYFPGVPGKTNPSSAQDDSGDNNFPVSLYIDLDNSTNPSTADLASLFDTGLTAFGDGPLDLDDSPPLSSMTLLLSSSTTSTPTSSATPPPAADICGDWYKFLFDHFEIYGKNFEPTKFDQDGSGLKKQIRGT
ncbi:MAG: hypothetical protein Q9217_006976, partial [Psora testacea]